MADKEQVIQALRATLISVKGALTIKQCNRDYRELQGEWIPFKKLGYPSLEKLFCEVPGFKVTEINGEWYVDAIASQETQHIAAMVSRQKTSKKATPKLSQLNRFPNKHGSWRKPASSNHSYNSNTQQSNQYYRAKGGTSYPYNNNSNKFTSNYNRYNKTNDYKTNDYKTNDNKTNAQNSRTVKIHNDESEKNNSTKSFSNIQVMKERDVNTLNEEINHSIKTKETETIAKQSAKMSASERLSNLRDRLNTVEFIPLQLPAANNECIENSDPVSHIAPAYNLEPPPDSKSSVEKLEWTCRKLGLPQPTFKVQDFRPKRGPVSYHCSIKVGNMYSASSYPDTSSSEELARETAALKLLGTVEGAEAGGLATAPPDRAAPALAALVADHEAGLWANMVPHLYREKYRENLPSNWLELVENSPLIIKDRVVNGLLVLLPNKEELSTPTLFRQTTSLDDNMIDSDLPPLQFPVDDFWNVFITVANSTLEIWLRIIGPEYSDAFETLLSDMTKYYEYSGTVVDKAMIIIDAWYAVNLEDGGWQRAKILEIEDDKATVFLGDHGDDDVVSLNMIKILEPQFRKLPAQGVLCRLEGLEELAGGGAGAVRRRLPGESLVAAPAPRADPADPVVPVVLYDTSTPRDLDLNKEILHDFCIAGVFTITQKLCEVEVGCVTDEGRVWVARAGGAAMVREALALLTAGAFRRPLPAAPLAPPPNAATLYIVRTLSGDWVRCTVISGLDESGTVRTLLVDSGLVLRAPLSSLVPLQAFSPPLDAFPHQAVQVRLGAADRVAAEMAGRLRELLLGARVVCRSLPAASPASPPASSPPLPNVELFVRTGPQNILASVNNNILMEYDFLNQSDSGKQKESRVTEEPNHVEAFSRKKERIFRVASSGTEEFKGAALPPPALPPPEKCFDVYVAMAANPWNFIVQPNSTRHTFQTMMASLQIECPKLSESEAPTNPASGELYTVFYKKDNTWYRVTIAGTVSSEMVSVYFCDFGDLELFPTKALRPVPTAVPLAHSLPPQAIKAKLFDVCPLHQDWTVEDCIRFQELCVEQQFVGICKEVGRDPLNPTEPLLTLDLIDTTTDEDVYLNKQLVAESRARLTSASNATTANKEGKQKESRVTEEPNHVEAFSRKKERIFRVASSGTEEFKGAALPPPALPPPEKCFDVYVAMAASPWNFIVQPNSTRHTFQTMMASLQIECPKLSESEAPTNPASGELYTVFYKKDNTWYRITIAGTVSSEMVSVYFCDFGDLELFPTKALRPVPTAVPLAHSLPPQAIKAKLFDVCPLHQDWTVEDCIRFQELCVEQQFVGICKEVGRDPLNPTEPLLTLDLIHTTTDEDVYLNKQLVAESRARLTSAIRCNHSQQRVIFL